MQLRWHLRSAALWLGGLVFALIPAAVGAADTVATSPPAAPPSLRLPDCVRIAQERQPALTARRLALELAESRARGLDELPRLAGLLRRDLPVRRQQSELGIRVAQEGLARTELETAAAVTRLYYAVQYARAQIRTAGKLVLELTLFQKTVAAAVKIRACADWTATTLDLINLYLGSARARAAEAELGRDLAIAALGEGMGVKPGECFALVEEPLPDVNVEVCRAAIVALAVERRGEVHQAETGAEATELEADAQARTRRAGTIQTFAAGSDIHTELIVHGVSHRGYQPSALAPMMPVTLSGRRASRVEGARELGSRSRAVADKTRGLVALEAAAAYLRWRERLAPRQRLPRGRCRRRARDQATRRRSQGRLAQPHRTRPDSQCPGHPDRGGPQRGPVRQGGGAGRVGACHRGRFLLGADGDGGASRGEASSCRGRQAVTRASAPLRDRQADSSP